MKFYGIEFNGKLMTFSLVGNGDAEFCNSYRCELGDHTVDPVWITIHRKYAEDALLGDTSWYNSCIDHPIFDSKQYPGAQVVEVQVDIQR